MPDTSRPVGRASGGTALRAIACVWSLVAGYVLLLAPWATRAVWNEALLAEFPRLQAVLLNLPARISISALGLALVFTSAWDVALLLRAEAPARPFSDP